MITFLPINQNPWVPQMFGLVGATNQDVLNDLALKNQTMYQQSESLAVMLDYGLSYLPTVPYTQVPVLYRGDGRNVAYYCNQVLQKSKIEFKYQYQQ